jgi:hypothetical protein
MFARAARSCSTAADSTSPRTLSRSTTITVASTVAAMAEVSAPIVIGEVSTIT